MPFVVSSVSRHWREVAIGFSELWSYIVIRTSDEASFERVPLMLERSHNHPLNIDIQLTKGSDLKRLIHLIVPHASRWGTFQLIGGGETLAAHFISELTQLGHSDLSVPLLRFVKLLDSSGSWPSMVTPVRLRSPSLRRLFLGGPCDASKLWLFDLGNLTDLTLTWYPSWSRPSPAFHDVMTLLKQTPLLQHLDLRLRLKDQAPCDVLPGHTSYKRAFSVQLPDLVSLRCGGFRGSCSDIWMWLVHISCPRLAALDLFHLLSTEGHQAVRADVLSALAGRLPVLKTFHWSPAPEPCPNTLKHIFEVAPSISHLAIYLSSHNDITKIQTMRDLLEWHALPCPKLVKISLDLKVPSVFYSDIPEWIRAMEDAGLEIIHLMPAKELMLSIQDNSMTWWEVEYDANGLNGGQSVWKPIRVGGIPI